MEQDMFELIEHTVVDSVKLMPFLFVTYLVMEYLECKTGDKTKHMIKKAGKWGPFIGGVLGVVPQCGFSAAASGLFAGRVITMGTLLAIFLSTSDEMLPILISEKAEPALIVKILAWKAVIGVIAGILVDAVFQSFGNRNPAYSNETEFHIHEMCEHEHCQCEQGIFRSALQHTLQITFFILVITFGLNLVLHTVGEEALAGLVLNHPIFGPVVSGMVGLIPNCAASVVITQLYLEGAMSFGAMMAGLLVGAGVGILVLCRVNHNKKQNLQIVGLLYLIGVVAGILLEYMGSFGL